MNEMIYRIAEIKDAMEIHSLMEQVYEQLDDQTLYVCDGLSFVQEHLSEKGFGLVVTFEEQLVGGLIVRFPQMEKDNLGLDIGLPESELCHVAHMESVVVHPDFRGRGIQSKLLQKAEEVLKKDQYQYLMATVAPKNAASIRSFENNGYQCVKTKEKYGGFLRRIYLKKFH